MIPRSAITHWNKQVPWEDIANVEQDLILTRALTDIFADEFLAKELAFRGGTALHKLYLSPQPRYSEDIDLVQIKPYSFPSWRSAELPSWKGHQAQAIQQHDALPDSLGGSSCCATSPEGGDQLLRALQRTGSGLGSLLLRQPVDQGLLQHHDLSAE